MNITIVIELVHDISKLGYYFTQHWNGENIRELRKSANSSDKCMSPEAIVTMDVI
jgi:hypothetical protein